MATNSMTEKAIGTLKRGVNAVLSPLGVQVTRVYPNTVCTLAWLKEARQAGMEINDYIEKDQSKPALSELEQLVFPHLFPGVAFCELGPGTGCYTRRLNARIKDGEFHIVDVDSATIEFLKSYLPPNPATHFHVNSGRELPFSKNNWLDIGFCTSMFTGVNLTYFYRYMLEFSRVLKPDGHFVFDYFDVATEAGWRVLKRNMARSTPIYAYNYHRTETVDRILDETGYEIIGRQPTVRGSVFVTARKR